MYVEVLKNSENDIYILHPNDILVLQDNDSKHKSEIFLNYFIKK